MRAGGTPAVSLFHKQDHTAGWDRGAEGGVDTGTELKAARAAEGQGPPIWATPFLPEQMFAYKSRGIPTI